MLGDALSLSFSLSLSYEVSPYFLLFCNKMCLVRYISHNNMVFVLKGFHIHSALKCKLTNKPIH